MIGPLDCFGFGLELHDRRNRRECFFAEANRIVRNVGQDRRLKEIADVAFAFSAGKNLGALVGGIFDLRQRRVQAFPMDDRPDLNTRFHAVADFHREDLSTNAAMKRS